MKIYSLMKSKIEQINKDAHFSEIFSGSAKVLLAKVFATIIGLGTSVIVARFYGAEIVGVVAILNSFFGIVLVFTLLGTTTSILRLIPEYKVKYSATAAYHLYRKIRIFVISSSMVIGLILFLSSGLIAGDIFGRPDLKFLFQISSALLVFKTLQSLSGQGIRAVNNINAYTKIQLVGPITYAVLLIVLTYFFYNKYNPIYIQYFNTVFVSLISLYIINATFRKQRNISDIKKSVSYKKIFNISFPMFLTSSMMVIMGQIDTLMIGVLRTETEVGYYAIGFKIAMMTTFVLSAINTVIAPKFSELFHNNNINELFKVAKKSTKLIFWTAVPILVIFVVFGKWLIINIYGIEFEKSYVVLVVISIGLFVDAISGSVMYFMSMCGFERTLRNIMFVALFFSVILNLLLIPLFGIIGAAIATAFIKILWNIMLTIYIYKQYNDYFFYIPLITRNETRN